MYLITYWIEIIDEWIETRVGHRQDMERKPDDVDVIESNRHQIGSDFK